MDEQRPYARRPTRGSLSSGSGLTINRSPQATLPSGSPYTGQTASKSSSGNPPSFYDPYALDFRPASEPSSLTFHQRVPSIVERVISNRVSSQRVNAPLESAEDYSEGSAPKKSRLEEAKEKTVEGTKEDRASQGRIAKPLSLFSILSARGGRGGRGASSGRR